MEIGELYRQTHKHLKYNIEFFTMDISLRIISFQYVPQLFYH